MSKVLVVLLLSFMVSAAWAGPECDGDRVKFCRGISEADVLKLGSGCLTINVDALKPQCREQVQEIMKKQNPCMADQQRFCPQEKASGRGLVKCLEQNAQLLSKACQAHNDNLKVDPEIENLVCGADYLNHCDAQEVPRVYCATKALKEGKFSKACKRVLQLMWPQRYSDQVLAQFDPHLELLPFCQRDLNQHCASQSMATLKSNNYSCLMKSLPSLGRPCVYALGQAASTIYPCLEAAFFHCTGDELAEGGLACVRKKVARPTSACSKQLASAKKN